MGNQQQVWSQVYEKRQQNEAQRRQLQQTEREGRIVAIDGMYDHWGEVIPHVRAKVKDVVQPLSSIDELPHALTSYHVVAIGCPGDENSEQVLTAILDYLRRGGTVVTTDWCLGQFLAPLGGWLGPALVEHLGGTGDEDVPVELVISGHPLLEGLGGLGHWHLDVGSHVCGVKDAQKIKVLIESAAMRSAYGSGVILFVTRVGEGRLVHFVSHAYAQPSDLQGAQAAAMILANVFDLAVAAGGSAVRPTKKSGWFRLVIGDERYTIRSDAPVEARRLDRATIKWLASDVADMEGNPVHRYVNPDVPIAEFDWVVDEGWRIRVPSGSKNSLVLDGVKVTSEWMLLPIGGELQIYSAGRGGVVAGVSMRIAE